MQASENTIAGQITETLRDAIVSGKIKPGSKLSEPKLALEYNISRGPLREALRRLEQLNLVRYIPREGVRVITLELDQVIEIYHVREALEAKAAALAAVNMTHEELQNLRQLLEMAEQHMEASGGTYIQADADIDFHYQIIQGSRNQMLIRTLCEDLYYLVRMFRYQSSRQPARSNQAFKEHQHLVYALEQRDAELAEIVMRKHIVRARLNIEKQRIHL